MTTIALPAEQQSLAQLRREWALHAVLTALFAAGSFTLLSQAWAVRYALAWLGVFLPFVLYQYIYLWRHLADNRLKGVHDAPLFPDLGPANVITNLRAVLSAAMAGFLLSPWPGGWLAWAPSFLYLISALLDYVDGYIARVTGRTTLLGEDLDMRWDGTGALFGSALSVFYGQTPLPYLLVGLARYAYVFGLSVRQKRGLPVYDLPPTRFRRAIAGMEMGFIAVVLMPLFGPPATQIAAVLFMTPHLGGFIRDYLWVTGRLALPKPDKAGRSLWKEKAGAFLPLFLRGLLVTLLVIVLMQEIQQASPAWWVVLVAGLAIPALLAGAAGRLFALAVLLMAGIALRAYPINWVYWVILFASTALFMTGTGRFSLWKPEEWLIYHRAGERVKPS